MENLFEEMIAGNFLNLGKETVYQVQEAESAPNKMTPRRSHQDTLSLKCKIKDKKS